MSLLSLTSIAKYMVGLLLVMLGFIPYEALEKPANSQQPEKQLEIKFEEEANRIEDSGCKVEYSYEINSIKIPDMDQTNANSAADSVTFLIVKIADDTTHFVISK